MYTLKDSKADYAIVRKALRDDNFGEKTKAFEERSRAIEAGRQYFVGDQSFIRDFSKHFFLSLLLIQYK